VSISTLQTKNILKHRNERGEEKNRREKKKEKETPAEL